ncbi:hypothetical protein BGX21_004005 [Mortierella sp. AD011]|nr:hypothetical protein BGX21_004005 [Mortierella sp. AD011]
MADELKAMVAKPSRRRTIIRGSNGNEDAKHEGEDEDIALPTGEEKPEMKLVIDDFENKLKEFKFKGGQVQERDKGYLG